MRRHRHSLSHYRLVSLDMGELVPVACFEVLPGDTVQQSTALLLRVSPLVTPVMHPVQVRVHHWFVPNRLVWTGWEDFITGGPDGLGGASGAFPVITAGGGGFTAGELLDYLGVPPGVASLEVSALPVRAANKVFNEFYRDEDLVAVRSQDDVTLPKVSWGKDYFTSSRPWTQKGPAVTLPLGTTAPVKMDASHLLSGAQPGIRFRKEDGSAPSGANALRLNAADGKLIESATAGTGGTGAFYPSNLYADLTAATAADVNTIRRAFALQRYAEARARYGSRYTEYLRYLGVRSSDARLQRPEYLGGGKQTIAFSEVLQTGPSAGGTGVADLKGHGIAAMRSNRYRRFIEEHGYVISFLSVRPHSMYSRSLHRHWTRRTRDAYWQKELELIGQQAIARREVYAEAGAAGDTVFGYQDRYAEYRHLPSTVHSEFRSTLNMWHLSREFASPPTLNASFVECVPSKRIHAVTTNDVLWVMVNNSIQMRRMVSKNASARVI